MKKIIALLLSAVLSVNAIQPVCAEYAAASMQPTALQEDGSTLQAQPQERGSISSVTPDQPQKRDSIPPVTPDQAAKSRAAQEEEFTFEFVSDEPYWKEYYRLDSTDNSCSIAYFCENKGSSPVTFSVSSTNTDVLKITSGEKKTVEAGGIVFEIVKCETVKVGYTDIIVSTGNTSYKQRAYVVPARVSFSALKQTDFNHITLKWKNYPGCSGYYVQRAVSDDKFETIQTVGAGTTSVTLPVKWNVEYYYQIVGYVTDDMRTVVGDAYAFAEGFTAKKMAGSAITSVKKSGSSNLLIQWEAFEGATGYKLYRSTQENGTYKCIYTAKSDTITSYKQKVSKGVTYYYKLVTVDEIGESDYSSSVSQIIPLKNKTKKISCSQIKQKASNGMGQYSSNWSHPDNTYYYQSGGKLNVVCVQNNGNLKIYTLSSSFKVKKTKTVKLKYDVWGGFYQGTDGNLYVAVGYQNPKESRKKTVVKVIQYNSNWKKLKTANITGGAGNTFEGIYSPFDAGNCRMDMQGSTLYLMTSRQMFTTFDGLRHQSNISFKIDTKNMKATEANESYASHSFNQFAKFKDGTLYLLDHGDAHSRSIVLTTVSDYGLEKPEVSSLSVLEFQGGSGDNFTGCRVGGMEIGSENVLICGTSQPHKNKIKKISGFGYDMKYNAFLAFANRKSGKITFKWLTTYHPKTTSVTVGETRMVKLSDNRFAILYTTTKKGKTTLNYVVYSDTGKKIYSKKYANMVFDGDSQPILYKGSIIWVSSTISQGKAKSKLYAIPAVF